LCLKDGGKRRLLTHTRRKPRVSSIDTISIVMGIGSEIRQFSSDTETYRESRRIWGRICSHSLLEEERDEVAKEKPERGRE